MPRYLLMVLVTSLAAVAATSAGDRDQPELIRALLLSGANNHDWRTTTPRIKQILEDSGRFAVTVLEQTDQISAELLNDFDVIVSDFNTFTARYKEPRDPGWTDAARDAYISFVRRGKGHVAVHAGSSSFYDWPEYQELVISSFKVGQTDHGIRHDFPVRIDIADHPITKGMGPFQTFDELWHDAPVQDEATVLASAFSSQESRGSGKYEPVAMVRRFGEGRSFTLMLGHDTKAMENAAFQALLARGTEWAATGEVTIPLPSEWPAVIENDLPAPPMHPFAWKRGEDSVALMSGDEVVWRFNYGDNTGKPHFHPLALPGRPALTWQSPPDHPWHRGLWFSWKFINGVNYWEEDRLTGHSEGRTEWSDVRVSAKPDHSARIEMRLAYLPKNELNPVMTESRVIEVSAPAADGIYHLDWTMTFTAMEDLVLDRTPLPDEPGGKVYGGYAGLSMRFTGELQERTITGSEGPIAFEHSRHRSNARAFDYSGLLESQPMGVAILDHPENLNSPSPWYVIKSNVMTYFSPAVICYGPHTMKKGESFTLRYRVIVHPGQWDRARLEKEHKALAGPAGE